MIDIVQHSMANPVFDALTALTLPWRLVLFAGVGLIFGSFLNVVIYRLPRMLEAAWQREFEETGALPNGSGSGSASAPAQPASFNLWRPASACPACGHRLRAWENIPVLSFILLRGRCRACRTAISARYPAIELLTAALSVAIAWRFGLTWQCLGALGLTFALIALAFIDLDTQLLPDDLTLPLLWTGLLCNLAHLFASLTDAVIGAAAGYAFLWLVYWLFRLLRGKEGMGYGDFKLLAALGAWLGWTTLPQIILLSSVTGAIAGIAAITAGRHARGAPIPFGPFLALGGWITLIGGDRLLSYLGH